MNDAPDPQHVRGEINPLMVPIYEALYTGAHKAREYFSRELSEEAPVDPFLGPQILRFWTKRVLISSGQEVSDEPTDLEMASLPNNGLCIAFGRYRIRILKSDRGRLPVPGSVDRCLFYSQQGSFNFHGEKESSEHTLNLVLMWEVDTDYNLRPLVLVCPEAGGKTRESVIEHWRIPIPLPIPLEGGGAAEGAGAQAGDLPYTRRRLPSDAEVSG